jgi:arginyl-tRNA synthetase
MHMGNARGGALGDSLARALCFCGAEVGKEFYLNDAGNQIEKLKLSLEARFRQLKGEEIIFQEEWYQGDDITAHARRWLDAGHTTPEGLTEHALNENANEMEKILESYNITYDIWFRESVLYKSRSIEKAIEKLRENGKTYEKDGALWLQAAGDVKAEVLIRANGFPTYFAADIAYHYNKFAERGFTRGINVWGADHGGHIARMKYAMECLGIDPKRLEIITIQLVNLIRDGKVTRMSKRKGDAVSLGDLIEEIGVDSARFFFNMRNANSAFDFDLDLAVKQSNENPVFYVQYAHARICSILTQAGADIQRYAVTAADVNYNFDHPLERALIKRIALFPREILSVVQFLEPSNLTTYVRNVAGDFHSFYNACPVNNAKEEDIRFARLLLVQAVRQTIKNAMGLLGVSAPERMAKMGEAE